MVSAMILGLLLGWLRAVSGSLIPCIVAHVTNNGLMVLAVTALPGLADHGRRACFSAFRKPRRAPRAVAVSAVLLGVGVALARARVAPAPADG
jgi:heme A synthase